MDLRPIEARADEFFTWIGRFDSGKRVDAAFASAADVPALIDEVKRLHAALRTALALLDRHEQDNPLGREQWNADIRDAITAHIDNTTKETYHPRRGTATAIAAAALADVQERVRRIDGGFVKESDHA